MSVEIIDNNDVDDGTTPGPDKNTVALHLDGLNYDNKNDDYEIVLTGVKITYLDIKNDIIKLKIPSDRISRIKTRTFNAEIYTNGGNNVKNHNNIIKTSIGNKQNDLSDESDHDHNNNNNKPDLSNVNNGNINAKPNINPPDDDNNNDDDDDDKDDNINDDDDNDDVDDQQQQQPQQPQRNVNLSKYKNIQPISSVSVKKEWNELLKKYNNKNDDQKLSQPQSPQAQNVNNITIPLDIDLCFERIVFILKYYTQWILYKDINFKSSDNAVQKQEDIISMTAFINLLTGYNKIKLLNDYYYILDNVIFDNNNNNNNYLNKYILSCSDILECSYCLNRLNNSHNELYNLSKLSISLRRDLYFISSQININKIAAGSVEERVEIGIQHYLDILYCTLLYPLNNNNNNNDNNKYTMNIPTASGVTNKCHLFGEYFTYWKQDNINYVHAKYMDLKTELLHNNLYKLSERDYFYLYNRSKDFILSIMGKKIVCKRIKMNCKLQLNDRATIGHIISIILYCNYYSDFICPKFINIGCCKLNNNDIQYKLRNSEIAHWCRLLNEVIFCFGNTLGGDDDIKLYYNLNKQILFNNMSIEYNIPISTTSSFNIIRKYNNNNAGVILRLGEYTLLNTKEYNYHFNLSYFSNYPLEHEYLIYGGKFEINDIIFSNKTHYNDVCTFKLYQKIIKGRWFSNNKIIFLKKYEKKLINYIQTFLKMDKNNNNNYLQNVFNNIVLNNSSNNANNALNQLNKPSILWINRECDKLLPELKKLINNKLVPFLTKNQNRKKYNFKLGYSTIIIMKIDLNKILESSFNKSLYSRDYKYPLLYLKNNRSQEILFHFRCYKKYDQQTNINYFKACFEIKYPLPECVSKVKIIAGLLLPQINYKKWDFITLTRSKLYSGSSLFPMNRIQNLNTILCKIAFQIKEVYDFNNKLIPTIDL